MERRIFITSSSNPRLKNIRRLRRCRRHDAFLVEGFRQVACALEGGATIREVYLARELCLDAGEAELAQRAERRGAAVLELSGRAFESISGQVRADGIAAVVERRPTGLDALRLEPDPLILVAEAVERPGNLGTIIRSACAAGADALVVAAGRTDPFHPEAVRGSVGTIFRLPVAEAGSEESIDWFQSRGVAVVVATPDGDRPCWQAELGGPTAIVVGNERHGVSNTWLEAADETVTIPMPGPADSLNVAVAAGVVLFEAARQRTRLSAARSSSRGRSLSRP